MQAIGAVRPCTSVRASSGGRAAAARAPPRPPSCRVAGSRQQLAAPQQAALQCRPSLRLVAAAAAAGGAAGEGSAADSQPGGSGDAVSPPPVKPSAVYEPAKAAYTLEDSPLESLKLIAPKRGLSAVQRWRLIKYTVLEALEPLMHTRPVMALLAALAAFHRSLQPLRDAAAWVQRQYNALVETYCDFAIDEAKQEWSWSRHHGAEVDTLRAVPRFVAYFFFTLTFQVLMPVSFLATVCVPFYYAWLLWDRWWLSPIFLATLATAPLKWVPWADKWLVWPGLI